MGQSYAFTIRDIEPYRDPAWHLARPEVRRAFWREVVRIGLEVKDRELARGIGVDGRKLARLSRYTILHRKSEMGRADPYAPPLTPAHEASRTRSLLAGRAHPDFAQFFWRTDPVSGLHWGKILGYHRAGSHRLPRRNVIGISDDSLAEVKERSHQWWENHKKGIVAEVEPNKLRLRLQLAPKPPKAPAPPKIIVTGRTDLDKFTFGIGGDKDMVAQSLEAGYFSGFEQFPDPGPARVKRASKGPPPKPKVTTIPIPKPPVPQKPPRASVPKPAPVPKPPKPTEVKSVSPPPPAPPTPPPPKEEVKPTQFGPDQVLECIRQLQAGEFAGTDLVPVYAIRRLVAQRYGPLNASHGILDPIIKGMRADGKIRLIAISDNRGATQDQLDNSIPGLNETLFYVIMR